MSSRILLVPITAALLAVPADVGAQSPPVSAPVAARDAGLGAKLAFGDRRVHVTIGDGRPILYEAVASVHPPTPGELAALAGRYVSEEAEASVEVRVRNGKLELSGRRLRPIPLEHVFGTTFAGGPAVVRFVRDRGAVTGLTISNGRSRGVVFDRR